MQITRVLGVLTLCMACGAGEKTTVQDAATDPMGDAAPQGDGNADGDPTCAPGTRGCECASGLCREGLQCEANVCRSDSQADAGDPRDGDTGAPCGDTSSDPNNCGACGRICESGTCLNGQCGNRWSACFIESDGFTTCEEVCASTGESCAEAGCDQESTLRVWGGVSKGLCEDNRNPSHWNGSMCSASLTWGGGSTYKRCCCTDSE